MSKPRKNALAGSGPIVDRARAALRHTATQFGAVQAQDDVSVTVLTPGGVQLRLGYEGGNYLFSRVYNLAITTVVPASAGLPAGLRLSHQDKAGPAWVPAGSRAGGSPLGRGGAASTSPGVSALNRALAPLLKGVDLLRATTTAVPGGTQLTLTPLGGAYVWVLIPPVFKATAFPAGEPQRLIDIVDAARGLTSAA